jgi:carbamoyltransferase
MEFPLSSPFVGPLASVEMSEVTREAVRAAVRVMAKGGVIALGTGKLEFGPRALGGRCLLGDPRRPNIRRYLNDMKGRSGFMPFAPVVLAELYSRYFLGEGSTNMAWTVGIRPEVKASFPGMDHASGQARVQVVSSEGPALLRRLLCEWEQESGCGMLLLTSLNGSGEAIPDTVEECVNIARRLGASGILSDTGWLCFS